MMAKPIGVMKMRDQGEEDDKIIAVHVDDPEYADYHEISELPRHRLKELERFFLDYKILEDKAVNVEQMHGRAEAERIIHDAVRLYRRTIAAP